LFNEKNNSVIEIPEAPELIEESIEEVEDVAETTNFEVQPNYDDLLRENSKKEILNQIKIAKQQAATKIKKLKESALSEATFDIKLKKKEFDKTLQDAKDTLVNEFVQISNSIKSELLDVNNDRYSEIKDTVSAKIGLLAENLQSNITEDFKSASKSFDANIRALVMELHTSSVLPKLKDELTVIASDVVEKVSKIEESLNDKLSNKVDVSMLEGVNNEINAIQIANVELNNNINKGVNKALSRLGNVNNKIDDAIVDLSESVDIKIKSATDNITNYYSSKIKELEDQTFEINESSRKYFIDLIQESKNNLIQEIRNIKKDAPIEYVIESKAGRTSKSFDSITSELDKKISDKISDEVIRLRKYISLYSGGGTVAQQFAAGGIMNGDLTVVGSISASNYLGLVIPNPDLSQYLPISGGTIAGNLIVNNTLSAYSLSADRIFASQLDALSANITVIDIKQYELSGFNVTGNCTIQGSVSSNNAVYGSNLVYLGGNAAGSNLIIGTNDSYNLALETDGVNRMTILSSGNTGIGTSTPNERLTVVGNISSSGAMIASNYNPGTNVAAFLQTPTSDNLRAALSDETGTGANVFANGPTINGGTIKNVVIPPTMATHVIVDEDFPNGSSAYALQGSGTSSVPNAERFTGVDKGYVRLLTGSVSGNSAYIASPAAEYVGYSKMFAKIRIPTITSVKVLMAIGTLGVNVWTVHRVGVLFDPALSNRFQFQWSLATITNSGTSAISGSPVVAANTDYILGMSVLGASPYQVSSAQSYKIGIWDATGTPITEQTFSFTSGGINSGNGAGVFIQTQTAATRAVYVDWLKILGPEASESFPFIETWN